MLNRTCLPLFFLCLVNLVATGQTAEYPIKFWAKKLAARYSQPEADARLYQLSVSNDSTVSAKLIADLKNEGKNSGLIFNLNLLQLGLNRDVALYFPTARGLSLVTAKLDEMERIASATGYPEIIGQVDYQYATIAYGFSQMEVAAFHAAKALKWYDEKDAGSFDNSVYFQLAAMLFQNREYAKSIVYNLKGLNISAASPSSKFIPCYYNTIGQAYCKLRQPDSAMFYFQKSIVSLLNQNSPEFLNVWLGINHTDMGKLFFEKDDFSAAHQLFRQAYVETKGFPADRYPQINAAIWLGKTHLVQRRYDSAALLLTEAGNMLDTIAPYLGLAKAQSRQNQLQAKAELFNRLGQSDSFYTYNMRYNLLHDSLERAALLSSDKIIQLRLKSEDDQLRVAQLMAAKEKSEILRNMIIAFVVLAAGVCIFIINKQKKLLAYKETAAQLKAEKLEAEAYTTRLQLEQFTDKLHNKTKKLEALEQQLENTAATAEQRQVLERLRSETILTDRQWNDFRTMFEKLYPGFFENLRQREPSITVAEQRLASLLRLQLDTKQMAAILGITADGVQKTRKRLRQRMQVLSDTELQNLLQGV